ncbi:MAG: hypothetical protein CTY24_11965 [Methylobacter sp.]|nr:MAG: hypothetical protein CTY24_11965 [Methylobacter sp.]
MQEQNEDLDDEHQDDEDFVEDYGYQNFDDEESAEAEEEVEYYAVRPNKSLQKRELADLFALGEELSKLSRDTIDSFNLPEKIHKAVVEVGKMPLTGARKRQLKFIAAQLFKTDVFEIKAKLALIQNKSAHATREHHITERWRDRLLTEGDQALSELLEEYPEADRQQLRQLIRNGQKEKAGGKPPKSSRLLYRELKTLFGANMSEEDLAENEQSAGTDEE